MTLETRGFLSSVIDALADDAIKEYSHHLALVDRCNRFALATLVRPRDISGRDADLFAAALFGRAIQDFEATVILTIRGLRAQSRAMARATLETALYCAAASRDLMLNQGARIKPRKGDAPTTSFVDAIEASHQRFRGQVATELRTMQEVPPEQASALGELLSEIGAPGKHQDIDLHGLAADLGLGDLYTVVYRSLSQDAHPSATSLQHHVEISSEGKIAGLRAGPDYMQCEDTLALAVCSLLVAVDGYVGRFGSVEELTAVQELVSAYREIHDLDPSPLTRGSSCAI